ncbi:hypothetical protein BGAL_0294g00170 [Botrytis galanthina]|uniref:Uncharacterized protein n=1 Tax=Botrytis galanthina TaxID=278940 RepID=A0A4S8QSB5_9HELO|nr:hypothetical protein BGAL_0294g00170 [Botrytis galanthina]
MNKLYAFEGSGSFWTIHICQCLQRHNGAKNAKKLNQISRGASLYSLVEKYTKIDSIYIIELFAPQYIAKF